MCMSTLQAVSGSAALNPVEIGAIWLHLVATVTLLGYFAVLGLLVLPVLRRRVSSREFVVTVAALERRALPLVIASLGVFLATGVYLMGNDSRYGGLGSIDSAWANVLLAKHLVVLVMVGLGVFFDILVVRAAKAPEGIDQAAQVRSITRAAMGMTILAAMVLLLTAVAQAG
jgi:uncharacterized membrane protein